jgi:hypothetical protein
LLVARDKGISDAIIGVGGFLGMGGHDVAIRVNHCNSTNKRILLPGASKEAVKAMPDSNMPTNCSFFWRHHASTGVRALAKKVGSFLSSLLAPGTVHCCR